AGLDRRSRAGRRHNPRSFNLRRGKPVTVAKMFSYMVERRDRLQVQRRQNLYPGGTCQKCPMLTNALLPRGCVASEQNSDGVKLRPRKAADPIVGMVRAGVTESPAIGPPCLAGIPLEMSRVMPRPLQARAIHSR